MCADWLAMAEEKGTTAIDWANKNINIRWKLTLPQVNLIQNLLNKFAYL